MRSTQAFHCRYAWGVLECTCTCSYSVAGLQLCTWPVGRIAQQKHQLVNRQTLQRVWLVYLQQVPGETDCSLLVNPGSECHRASHPEGIWTPEEWWAAVLVTIPKIDVFFSGGAVGGVQTTWDGGGAAPRGSWEPPPHEWRKCYWNREKTLVDQSLQSLKQGLAW